MLSQKTFEDNDVHTYLTVSALTKYIKVKLEGDKHLFSILIKGEISNFKRHSRGHLYFTLKDENAQISAIMFAKEAMSLLFSPKEGDHVLIEGRISLYEPSGTYSIQVSKMDPDGIGELYLKYEALKVFYEEKGYFAASRKKPIPKFPQKIGVITSPTGAVVEDIKHTVSRRYMLAEIHLYPALVQGQGSAESISNMILLANQKKEVDVIIVGRGGGSIEDLWAFNEPLVIEAIYQSKIPIIAAIGHETDITISDYVADLRAPTPTAAAELSTPNKPDLMDKLSEINDQISYRLFQHIHQIKTKLVHLDQRLDDLSPSNQAKRIFQSVHQLNERLNHTYQLYLLKLKNEVKELHLGLTSPLDKIQLYQSKHHYLTKSLHQGFHKRYQDYTLKTDLLNRLILQNYKELYAKKSHPFEMLRMQLEGLNPLSIMDRGFAVIKKDHRVITSVDSVEINDELTLRLKDGWILAKVKNKEKK